MINFLWLIPLALGLFALLFVLINICIAFIQVFMDDYFWPWFDKMVIQLREIVRKIK